MQVLEGAFNPDAAQKLGEFLERFKPTFPVGLVSSGFISNYSQITPDMRPTVPILFFIDRKFVIRGQFFGSDLENVDQAKFIRAELDKLLGPAPASAQKKAAKK